MTVLVYGVHKVSEPWAYDAAKLVLQKNKNIIGIECPDEISQLTDYIPVFDRFVKNLRLGVTRRKGKFHEDLSGYHQEIYESVFEWDKAVEARYPDQSIFDLHGGIFLAEDGFRQLARFEFGYEAWQKYSHVIQRLSSMHGFSSSQGISIGDWTIEIMLPHTSAKLFGVNPDYVPELEELVNQGCDPNPSKGGIKINSLTSWEGKFQGYTIWQASAMLLPDVKSQEYQKLVTQTSDFLCDLFANIK